MESEILLGEIKIVGRGDLLKEVSEVKPWWFQMFIIQTLYVFIMFVYMNSFIIIGNIIILPLNENPF